MFFVKLLSYLPSWCLYPFAEAGAFLGYHILRYRKEVILNNISAAFPEKSDTEVKKIARQFYRHFCQVFIEMILAYSYTKKDWQKRMPITNPQDLLKYLDNGVPAILMSGHVANWEWPAFSFGRQLEYTVEFLHKPVDKKGFEKIMHQLRTRHGGIPIPKDDALREIVKRRKQPRIIGIIGDQLPAKGTEKQWLNFLNQETAFYVGAERIAKLTQYVVFYADIKRNGLGKYEATLKEIAKPPYRKEFTGVIEKYAACLEESIQRNPSDYLWSHKRWKYTKAQEEAALSGNT
ncbi:lysophospholipid acyltransferase family protein [Roseivirga sp.]|uniref:lysophospholipid acyltransferase family protein n=1 Tax=Roseivirga sp. TaxID=1964215 RepID=UPI003B8E06AA